MEVRDSEEAIDHVTRILDWSENFQYPTPATLFLDLIGYSADNYDGLLLDADRYESVMNKLGYLELDMLGLALIAYATYPEECRGKIKDYENPVED